MLQANAECFAPLVGGDDYGQKHCSDFTASVQPYAAEKKDPRP